MTFRGLSFTEEERAVLQQRVALFWKVIFLIALFPVVHVAEALAPATQPVEDADVTLTRRVNRPTA